MALRDDLIETARRCREASGELDRYRAELDELIGQAHGAGASVSAPAELTDPTPKSVYAALGREGRRS